MSSNSSQYRTIFNVDGQRDDELKSAVSHTRSEATVAMAWGTLLENVSGYLFSLETGLTFQEIGSIAHPRYSRIRGSVDGFGLDSDGRLFALETKTPFSRIPTAMISEMTYVYQMIQNMEIIDADYALFNDVRLLPCASIDLSDRSAARNPRDGILSFSRYMKYGQADRMGVKIVATSVVVNDPNNTALAHVDPFETKPDAEMADVRREEIMTDERREEVFDYDDEASMSDAIDKPWFGNIFDAMIGKHPSWSPVHLDKSLLEYAIGFKPIGYSTKETDMEWVNTMYGMAARDKEAIGISFFRVDAHNIQRIERSTQFWETVLRPRALQWIDDLDAVASGKKPSIVPRIAHSSLPRPPSLQ